MLWYGSLRPINLDWNGLQNQFQQQYSKIGNTRKQLFLAWRSFHFDKNTKTLDAHITCIGQVATFILTKIQNIRCPHHMHWTGSYIIRLWQTSGIRSFQKYTPNKIILGTPSHKRLKISSRKQPKEFYQKKR